MSQKGKKIRRKKKKTVTMTVNDNLDKKGETFTMMVCFSDLLINCPGCVAVRVPVPPATPPVPETNAPAIGTDDDGFRLTGE